MNKQLDTLLTLRDNINVAVQTLLNNKDVMGDALPVLPEYEFDIIEGAEMITRHLMYAVDPTTNPAYEPEATI